VRDVAFGQYETFNGSPFFTAGREHNQEKRDQDTEDDRFLKFESEHKGIPPY